MSAASNDELWIGLNDKKEEGLFDWSDHSTVRFTSWEFSKPGLISVQEDCVLIRGEVRSNIWMLPILMFYLLKVTVAPFPNISELGLKFKK